MTVTTQVVWTYPTPQETIDLITAKGNELIAEGKGIGTAINAQGPGPDQVTITRAWTDEPTALEWIAFVELYDPVSATIIS
jgi:hypothetical protein